MIQLASPDICWLTIIICCSTIRYVDIHFIDWRISASSRFCSYASYLATPYMIYRWFHFGIPKAFQSTRQIHVWVSLCWRKNSYSLLRRNSRRDADKMLSHYCNAVSDCLECDIIIPPFPWKASRSAISASFSSPLIHPSIHSYSHAHQSTSLRSLLTYPISHCNIAAFVVFLQLQSNLINVLEFSCFFSILLSIYVLTSLKLNWTS